MERSRKSLWMPLSAYPAASPMSLPHPEPPQNTEPSRAGLQDMIAPVIADLRNARNEEHAWPKLRSLVEPDPAKLVDRLSIRWLVSVCDTYADFAEPPRCCHALAISVFVNMLRLAETCRYTRPAIDPDRWERTRTRILPLYDGLTTFAIDRQDTFLNLSRRLHRQLRNDALMLAIWTGILERLRLSDNAITEFARDSPVAARYFPADPTGMLDNYGR